MLHSPKDTALYQHQQNAQTGVLMINLGTPDAPDSKSVRRYLKEFLWDPRIVEVPRAAWWFILNGIILNTRPKRSAEAYASIWQDGDSPLRTLSAALVDKVAEQFEQHDMPVELAMRYGQPSIAAGLEKLQKRGARRILILPLYPQYSATTTASTFDGVAAVLKKQRWIPELRFINHYHDHPQYIDALTQQIKRYWQQHQRGDHLLLSFHGIPQAYFDAGDPYFCECHKTSRLLTAALGLNEDQWSMTFQSRLGPKQWLKPYTSESLKKLAASGTQRIDVVCPGFSIDCLETLEEIQVENRDYFMQAGGQEYHYIPCLNDSAQHVDLMSQLIQQHTQGWN